MVIVDSSVWVDALRGTVNHHSIWLGAAIGREDVGLTSLIVCEVLQGFRIDVQFREFQDYLLEFPIFDTLDTPLAIRSAQNFRFLRKRGITVRKTVDCIIATFCIEHDYHLLHNDRDFDPFETHLGLKVVHPPGTSLN
jgi:hypothetical protein